MRFSSHRSIAAIVIACALGPPALVEAQQCAEGRVSTPETLGRCCWPGQSFSETLGRCSGPPQCPPPFVAEGDTCVVPYSAGYGVPPEGWPTPDAQAPSARGPGVRAPRVPPGAVQLRWPDEPASITRAIISPRLERGMDDGLLAAGLSVFFGGYVGALVIGGIDEAVGNCERSSPSSFRFESAGCGSWPYAFIPVVGPILAGTVIEADDACCRNAALGLAAGIPMMLVQVFGLTLTGLAVFGNTETMVPGQRGGEARVTVLPYATDREAGTWLRVEL